MKSESPMVSRSWLITFGPGQDLYKQLHALDYEASIAYDICVCVEETQEGLEHVHAALRYNYQRMITPQTLCVYGDIAYDAQCGQTDDDYVQMCAYVKKHGVYYHRREHLPSYLSDPAPVWRRWQLDVLRAANDSRKIIVVYDPVDITGKTYLTLWHCCRYQAVNIAVVRGYQDIMRSVFARPSDLYFVDLPRALSKKGMQQMIAALETVKNGYSYDDRYAWQERYQDPPKIVVYTNEPIPRDWLSLDRWHFVTINAQNRPDMCAKGGTYSIVDPVQISYIRRVCENLYTRNAQYNSGDIRETLQTTLPADASHSPEEIE